MRTKSALCRVSSFSVEKLRTYKRYVYELSLFEYCLVIGWCRQLSGLRIPGNYESRTFVTNVTCKHCHYSQTACWVHASSWALWRIKRNHWVCLEHQISLHARALRFPRNYKSRTLMITAQGPLLLQLWEWLLIITGLCAVGCSSSSTASWSASSKRTISLGIWQAWLYHI